MVSTVQVIFQIRASTMRVVLRMTMASTLSSDPASVISTRASLTIMDFR